MNTSLSRRDFLKTGAAAAAVAALSPAVSQGAGHKRDIKRAIMYATIGYKGSVLEKFKAMKAAGFDGIEPMGGLDQKEVVDAFAETGLKAASVCCHTHWAKPFSAPDEATRKIGFD